MLEELRSQYGVKLFVAVLKAANYRSLGLLRSLGFMTGSPEQSVEFEAEADEVVMIKAAGTAQTSS